MGKKKLIEEALIEAKELERASIQNATNMVIESFQPNFVDFFKGVLNEVDDMEMDDEFEDEELEEGNEHDMGKEPDPGRRGTDPAIDDDEEAFGEEALGEGQYDDVSGDATPEKGQAGLPNKPAVKKVGKGGWEDEGSAGLSQSTSRESQKGTPSTKNVGDGGWEDEGSAGYSAADPEKGGKNGLNNVPAAKVVKEAEDEESEEDFEIPDDLFDDEDEDMEFSDDENDIDIDVKDDFGDDESEDELGENDEDEFEPEEDDLELSDDSGLEDDDDEEIDLDIEEDDFEDEESLEGDPLDNMDLDDEDEFEEGLYMRKEGEFQKVTPAEYLKTRLGELEEENEKLSNALNALGEQLQETHLFNAKLAHLNKLYMSGAFSNGEKESIAERLDICESVDEVKRAYKNIVIETRNRNPLDDFSNMIKENRTAKKAKTENIYESTDVARMRSIMDKLG
jgi:hypothetical protein